MKCSSCGENTKVTDSRDDSSTDKEWLVQKGRDAFGWWSNEFRLRLRVCKSCDDKATTIEVPLDDLVASYADIKERLKKAASHTISTEKLLGVLESHDKNNDAASALGDLLTELLWRRGD